MTINMITIFLISNVVNRQVFANEGIIIQLKEHVQDNDKTGIHWWITYPNCECVSKANNKGSRLRFFIPKNRIDSVFDEEQKIFLHYKVKLLIHVKRADFFFNNKMASYFGVRQNYYRFFIDIKLTEEKPEYSEKPQYGPFSKLVGVNYVTSKNLIENYVEVRLRPFDDVVWLFHCEQSALNEKNRINQQTTYLLTNGMLHGCAFDPLRKEPYKRTPKDLFYNFTY